MHNQTLSVKLVNKLNLWSNGKNPFPILEVIDVYHEVGKHFVSDELLSILVKARERLVSDLGSENKELKQLINMLLDKHDNKYDYRSYLGLELLGLPNLYEENEFCTTEALDRKKLLLGYDIMRFELSVFNGEETWLPLRPADKKTVVQRCHRVLEVIKNPLQRLKIASAYMDNMDNMDEESIIEYSQNLCQIIMHEMSLEESLRLKYTMIPVYKIHDEYMFIRVLQSFETIFTWIAFTLKCAINLGKNEVNQIIALIHQCSLHLVEAFRLFALLGTISPKAFMEFRVYTEGASAIQSRSYKQIESLCARPSEKRLNSVAYYSVPNVRNFVLNNSPTLDDIYSQIMTSENESAVTKNALTAVLKNFELELHRWRTMHYGLASRILGKNATSGTGYTDGLPYLKDASNVHLFNLEKRLRKTRKTHQN